jgi:hypothetical protein
MTAEVTHAATTNGLALSHITRFNHFDIIALALSASHFKPSFLLLNVLSIYHMDFCIFPHIVLRVLNIALAIALCKQNTLYYLLRN